MRLPITLFFFILLFSQCSPTYVNQMQLTPIDEGLGSITAADVTIELDLHDIRPVDILVDVKITNHSSKSITIEPNTFFYNALSSYNSKLADIYAYDPISLLDELDEILNTKQKARKKMIGWGWALAGLTAATAAISAENNSVLLEELVLIGAPTSAEMLNLASGVKREIKDIFEERKYYDLNMMRPKVLEPSESIKGLIIFPRYDQAETLLFTFPMRGLDFQFPYQQYWNTVPMN